MLKHSTFKHIGKCTFLLLFLLIAIPFIYSQITLETLIANGIPVTTIETYSRFTNDTDNFPLRNFSICIGEENNTILMRFIAQDKNSYVEIQNVSWKIESIIDGVETTIPSFGSSFKQATFDSTISVTENTYMENITLTNNRTKRLYKITTNVTDTNNDSSINTSYFTLHRTDCIRVEQNASLVESEPFQVHVDYCELSIVVNENITGRIIVTLHNDSPVDSNVQTALDKYITVDVEGVILQETINLSLITNYTQAEITTKGLDESSLRLYKFGSWNLQEGSVDPSLNEVTLVVNESTISDNYSYRLGTYSIRGSLEGSSSSSESSSSSAGSSSSGGGGGGGAGGSFKVPSKDSPSGKRSSSGSSEEENTDTTDNNNLGKNNTEENRNINKEHLSEYSDRMDLFSYIYSECFIYLIIILFLLLLFLREWKLRRELEKRFIKKKQPSLWVIIKQSLRRRDHSIKYCYHCGKKIEKASHFCEHCGKKQVK